MIARRSHILTTVERSPLSSGTVLRTTPAYRTLIPSWCIFCANENFRISPFSLASITGLVLALCGPAVAGVADSPLPLFGGQKTKHVFTIPGVISHATLATVIVCTSLEKKKDLRWGIEIFASGGGAPEDSALDLLMDPGGSQAVATVETTYSGTDMNLSNSSLPRSARVVATSKKLACSAMVVEEQPTGAFSGVGWSLSVIKKTSQKGD